MTKYEIAAILDEIAFLLELKGENPFKARAYRRGGGVLQAIVEEPAALLAERKLDEVKGIGLTLAATVEELVTGGSCQLHVELLKLFPRGLLELAGVPGLGPKKLKVIHDRLGVSSLGELQYACIENQLVDLPGFGRKVQERILTGIR